MVANFIIEGRRLCTVGLKFRLNVTVPRKTNFTQIVWLRSGGKNYGSMSSRARIPNFLSRWQTLRKFFTSKYRHPFVAGQDRSD